MERIQQYTSQLKSPDGLGELEREPAFKRRKINLENTTYSSEEKVSRYQVGEDKNGNSGLRDNSFLHDNVD